MKPDLLIVLLLGLSLSLPVSAKMYKWVDDKGTTHYGETIPPEYANKDRQLLNKSGVVIKTQDIMTPEERRAAEAETAKSNATEEAARDRKRYDKSLVNTYSSVEEIELSRIRNIQQVEARINSVRAQLKPETERLANLQKETKNRISSGKPVPPSLQDDMTETQNRIKRMQQDMDKYLTEKSSVEARFAADKLRYKELTGK
jgi:chromosome segregation ATPase